MDAQTKAFMKIAIGLVVFAVCLTSYNVDLQRRHEAREAELNRKLLRDCYASNERMIKERSDRFSSVMECKVNK